MNKKFLESTARKLVAPGKGILAADESTGTIAKRLAKINVESAEDNRRAYRELLLTAPNIETSISGVILFDETIRQNSSTGIPFVEILRQHGIIPIIKVDKGTVPLPGSPNELLTEGLDGLAERLAEYKKLGADSAKWRAVITIGEGIPTMDCIVQNAKRLAEYAWLCQENDIVPIVEPEVLMDDPTSNHTIERCREVTKQTLDIVFVELRAQGVLLSGMILKPNMVVPASSQGRADVKVVAEQTLACLHECVPSEVPGIVFLSGGQKEVEATENLQAINAMKGDAPWALSFSYGRALQSSTLETWGGKAENVAAAQAEFAKRAKMNGLATLGKYIGE